MLKMFFIFVVLQLGDFGTTAAVLSLGGSEQNPLVQYFMNIGSLEGLAVAKALSLGIGVVCLVWSKYRALRLVNVVFTGIVAWNLTVLLLLMV